MLRGLLATTGDDCPLNMTDLFRHAVATHPEQEIVFRGQDGAWHRSDYATEWRRIAQIGHALTSLGVEPGDVVGVMDWNSVRHLDMYFAVPALGATMLQLNLRLGAEDLGYVIEHSGVRWVCVDESLLPLAEAHAEAEGVRGWIVLSDRPGAEVETSLPHPVFLEDLMSAGPEEYPWEPIEETTAAYAGYTTGTTGRPKGILYSHRAMYLHSLALNSELGITSGSCVMPVTPMFHVMSWGFPQAAVAAAAKLVLPGRYQMSELDVLTDALVREGVTVANGAPAIFGPMLTRIQDMGQALDLSSTVLICGATEPPLAMMKGYKQLTGANVVHAYGASETSPVATVNMADPPADADDAAWDRKRLQGRPPLGVEIAIMDPTGEMLPHDGSSAGEILLRGPWVTTDYHDRADAAESFRDGWWRSGDIGVLRPDGYLKVTDRLKDVIKSGGEWISSIDMENAILDNDRVAEAAVIGVPDPTWEERPVAYVVPRPNAGLTEESVRDTLVARFADWQVPEKILLVGELPKTSVGKLDKKALRAGYSPGPDL